MENKREKILYIAPDYSDNPLKARILRRMYFNTTPDGYFEDALHSAYEVHEYTISEFFNKKAWRKQNFDFLVINYKSSEDPLDKRLKIFKSVINTAKVPAILFIGSDRAQDIPNDEIFDAFSVVFKREPYRDLSKYNISEKNRKKIYPTMLICPLIFRPRNVFAKLAAPLLKPNIPAEDKINKNYDVFFSGRMVKRKNNIRLDVWRRVVEEGFAAYGGLQPRPKDNAFPPEDLSLEKLSKDEYINSMRGAKINLALDGIGEFTFRHLEVWCLGEFMISSPTIRDLDLPIPAKEDVHYVSYNSLDELVDKMKFYINHKEERDKIAQNGKKLFDRWYNPVDHGRYIREAISTSALK